MSIESRAWKKLQELYGEIIITEQLRSLAIVVSEFANVKLTRKNKKSKKELIKWYDENYEIIFPFLISKVKIIKKE